MTHSINNLGFCPTTPGDIAKPKGCEISFYTSHHGCVAIRTGSANEKPKEYKQHIWDAAQKLMQEYPEYENAVRKTWKLHAV
jgi:hypothetical protein